MTGRDGPGEARRLPAHVRALRWLSARSLPGPAGRVAVRHGIAVPAGDSVPLLTDHYVPLGDGPFPALLVRTPYGRGFPWDYVYGAQFAALGFHVLIQSCRGTGGSGGTFDPWRQEVADGQASVAWLREQEWFSGALGVIGTSYLGYAAWALAAGAPPELRAIVADGSVDPHAFMYPGGALALQNVLAGAVGTLFAHRGPVIAARAFARLRRHQRHVMMTLPLIDAYPAAIGGRSKMFEEWLANPDPADPYWDGVDLTPATASLAVPVSLVTGWDDAQLDQTLEQYRRRKEAGCDVRLIVGPWNHTSIFDQGYPEVVPRALAEFRARLSGGSGNPAEPPVRVHVGGSGQWRDLPEWPPPQSRARAWYLGADGVLGDQPSALAGSSSFRYDPSDPTPSAGGRATHATPARKHRRQQPPDSSPPTFRSSTTPMPVRPDAPRRTAECLRCRSFLGNYDSRTPLLSPWQQWSLPAVVPSLEATTVERFCCCSPGSSARSS